MQRPLKETLKKSEMAEQVIIEFISDTSGLQPAEDRLAKLGKIDQGQASIFKQTNAELAKREAILKQSATSTDKLTLSVSREQVVYNKVISTLKSLSGESKKVAQSLIALPTDQVAAGFEEVGLSVQEYFNALQLAEAGSEKLEASSASLKSKLNDLTAQLQELREAGKGNTDEYHALVEEAGNVKNAISGVSAEVKNAGSDTKGLDNLIGTAQALTGAFAVAQGTTALFGDESEELQETLLNVNSTMAILQGFQAVQNSLQKEGALSLLALSIQQKVRNAGLVIENGLQSTSVVARTAATAAQWLLNAAMSANPIGIVIVGLTALVAILGKYGSSVKQAAKDTATLEGALRSATVTLEAETNGIEDSNTKTIASLEERGARTSNILKQEQNNERLTVQARIREREKLRESIVNTAKSTDSDIIELRKENQKRLLEIDQEISDQNINGEVRAGEIRKQLTKEALEDQVSNANAALNVSIKNSKTQFDTQRQLAEANAALEIQDAGENGSKIKEIRATLNRELRDIDIAAAKVRHDDRLAALNAELSDAQAASKAINERGSQDEVDAQKKIIQENTAFELTQEGLTENQKIEIRKKALNEIAQIQKDFNKQSSRETLEDLISRNNAELSAVNIGEREKLDLKIENIIAAAEIEVEANSGLTDKIKEINKKRDADIKAARLQSIEETVAYELALQDSRSAGYRRSLERIVNNENAAIGKRTDAIDKLTGYELESINKKIDALQNEHEQKLISEKEYNLRYSELLDDQVEAVEAAEDQKAKLVKASNRELFNNVLDVAGQVVGTLSSIYELQAEKENNHIEGQRKRVDELRETGAITEKEALVRMKKIDAEERKIKQKQAQRDKQIAIFNAIISTAAAVAKALPNIPLAIIAGVLGAVQIGIIAARPVPQFYKGKKDSYEGPGEVGERGAELVEKDGRMYLVDKPQVIWLGKKDKVYNPAETKAMMATPSMNVNKQLIGRGPDKIAMPTIDYKRLGKAVGENIPKTGLNIDEEGFTQWIKKGNSFEIYLNKRRSF